MARIKGMSGTYLILSFVVVVDRLQSLLKEKRKINDGTLFFLFFASKQQSNRVYVICQFHDMKECFG